MALNSPPKKISTLIRKYTCVVKGHDGPRYFPYQYQNQRTLDELDEVLRTATAADVNHKDAWGEPTLILAISSDECIRRLLTVDGIDVNIVNEAGNTPLMEASMAGKEQTVELLLQHKYINVNHRNKMGNTAFILAARSSCNDVIKVLLQDLRLDVNATNGSMRTAMMSACESAPNMATVRMLLESERIDVHWENEYGEAALQYASSAARKVVQAHLDSKAALVTPIVTPVNVPIVHATNPSTAATPPPCSEAVTKAVSVTPVSPVTAPSTVRRASPAGSVLSRAQVFGSTTTSFRSSTPAAIRSVSTSSPVALVVSATPNVVIKSEASITFRGSAAAPTRSPIPTVHSASAVGSVLARAQVFGATTAVSPKHSNPVPNHPVGSPAAGGTAAASVGLSPESNSARVLPEVQPNARFPVSNTDTDPAAAPQQTRVSTPQPGVEGEAPVVTPTISIKNAPQESVFVSSASADPTITTESSTLPVEYIPISPSSATSWLASNLLHSGFDSHQVQLCDQKLVIELGLVSERLMGLFAPTEFTAEYLTGLGITVIGVQKHLLAMYQKLHAQYTPCIVVTDTEMQDRVRALENTVKALQAAVHEQKIVNKVQQERFDGIMTLLDIPFGMPEQEIH